MRAPLLRLVLVPLAAAALLVVAFVDKPARAVAPPAPAPVPARGAAPTATRGTATVAPTPATAARATAAGGPRALLWKVSDADNHLYLLGSFHVLKPTDYPLPASIDAAFADAERIAFEVSPAEMRSPALAQKMLAAGMSDDGRTLSQRLKPTTWRKLEAYCASRGIPCDGLQSFEPWMASLVISLSEATKLGYASDQGLDQVLIDRALAANKPGSGLETADQQIDALAGMGDAEQEQSLLEALDDVDGLGTRMEQLHDDWRRGDEQAIERLMTTELRDTYPALYQRINVARNDAWLPKLRAMLDGGSRDDTLVVVGSMHLLGEDGLVAKLRRAGYRVERL